MVRRGRGEAERARAVLARLAKVVFGATGLGELGSDPTCTYCTVGRPVPCVEDAVSSYSVLAAKGELTVTERVGDVSLGDDISKAQSTKCSPSQNCACWLDFSLARRLSCLLLGLLVFKILCALTINPFPHRLPTRNCLDSSSKIVNQRCRSRNCCVSQSLLFPRSFAEILVTLVHPRPHSLSHKLGKPRLGSETTCEVVAAAAVEQ